MSKAVYESDTAALEAAGKKQVLKREWNFWAVLAMSCCTLCTWEATSALFAGAYTNGGPVSVVYGFIIATIGTFVVAASMAEMASISPIAGAQYHWTAEHAPRKWRAPISYLQGWITITGWVAAIASVCYLVATMILGVAILNNPNYVEQRWHATLLMILLVILAALGNTAGKKLLPLWETLAGAFHVIFFFIIWIAVLASSKKAPSKDVWATFINAGGWNDGVSFCLGFVTPAFALAGVDAVVHLSEETYSAPLNIPRAMIWSVVINGAAGFLYIIAILYAITDADTVLSTPTGYPIIGVFLEAFTNNTSAVTAAMVGIILVFSMMLFGCVCSVSRLIWAFSRDKGLPFSDFFSRITEWNRCPTNCVLLCVICVALLSLINIGSVTAFNALISLTNLGFYFSYCIPIVLFAIRRFDKSNPITFGPWNLGKFGLICNILAIAFCVFLIIFLPFPAALPVSGETMNYASPVFVGVLVLAAINYVVRARKRFTGPIQETSTSEHSSDVQVERENVTVDEKHYS